MNDKPKTRVLLLTVSSTSFFYDQVVMPFGLISIGSYLDYDKFEIKGLEMNTPPNKVRGRYLNKDVDFLTQIIDFNPEIIAMTTYASNIYNAIFWAALIKEAIPKSYVVMGGNHASYMPREILSKSSAVDGVVSFEGEVPFKMLCESIRDGNRDFSRVPGLTYRGQSGIANNPPAKLLENLESLPALNFAFFENEADCDLKTHADMITARGCPYNCTFCNCNHFWTKRYRVKSVERVIAEIAELKQRYPNLASIRFRDESMTIDKNRCIELCREIASRDFGISFEAHSRLDGLNEDVIEALSKAKVNRIYIGMESGSKEVLKRIKKEIDIDLADRVISLLRKHGVSFRVSFLGATPGERFQETMETIKLIKRLKLKPDEYYMGFGIQIYPGTADAKSFLSENPGHEWITRNNKFKGAYSAVMDGGGNVICPVASGYGMWIKAFILLALDWRMLARKVFHRIFR